MQNDRASADTHGLFETSAQVTDWLEATGDGPTILVGDIKVSASEKVSTGQYENYNPHATMDATVALPGPYEEHQEEIKAKILQMEKDLQAVLQEAVDARLADEQMAVEDFE